MAKKSPTQRTATTKQNAWLIKQKQNADLINENDEFQDRLLEPDKESDFLPENFDDDAMATSVDVYQLKKRIKELEGELEDTEDDLVNAETKLKKKRNNKIFRGRIRKNKRTE